MRTSINRSSRLGALCSAAAAVALLAAGCGGEDGDGGGGDGAGAALTKQEYIAEGDAICARGTELMAQEALQSFEGQQPSTEEAEQFGQDVVAPTLENQLTQLRELPAPAGDEDEVSEIYDAVEEAIGELRSDPELFIQPNTGGAFDEANRLARAYGFRQCGSG